MEDDFDFSNLKKKKRVNSRTKGSSFERSICKILNERFNTTEFSRSPGSGAFATTHSLPEHLKIYGDLITPEKFKFCIECKKGYNHLNLYSLYNYSSEFWKFIEQCEKDSKKCSSN
jgi:Holliday junction resolvase